VKFPEALDGNNLLGLTDGQSENNVTPNSGGGIAIQMHTGRNTCNRQQWHLTEQFLVPTVRLFQDVPLLTKWSKTSTANGTLLLYVHSAVAIYLIYVTTLNNTRPLITNDGYCTKS